MPRSLTLLVFDGVADGSVGVTLDIIGAATRIAQSGALLDMPLSQLPTRPRLVSVDGKVVRTAAGRELAVDGRLSAAKIASGDLLVIPGLGMATPQEVTSGLGRADIARAEKTLCRVAARGAWLAASCSATFVLAQTGLLNGKEATTTWWLRQAFQRRFPRIRLRGDRMVVRDGRLFTSGSAFAHADLVLALLSATISPSLAHFVASYLVLDERASQAQYMVLDHLQNEHPTLRALEEFIKANLCRQLTVRQMAAAVGTSPRTLARHLQRVGTTPLQLAQRLRVTRAAHLLETTTDPVDHIAAQVGYADAAAFRRIYRRELGQAPGAARRRAT